MSPAIPLYVDISSDIFSTKAENHCPKKILESLGNPGMGQWLGFSPLFFSISEAKDDGYLVSLKYCVFLRESCQSCCLKVRVHCETCQLDST